MVGVGGGGTFCYRMLRKGSTLAADTLRSLCSGSLARMVSKSPSMDPSVFTGWERSKKSTRLEREMCLAWSITTVRPRFLDLTSPSWDQRKRAERTSGTRFLF